MSQSDQGSHRSGGVARLTVAIIGVWISFLASPFVQAQIFGGGGLFNKKPEAPRAQTEDEIGVPTPVRGRVEALKGHEVTFEIRAETKTPAATAEFLIRVFPSAGKIVSMVSNPGERNKALVTYWADPASSATSDAFSFAVRYRGGRYSPEMRFDIDLVDLKAEVQVPATVDFGEVMVGEEEVRTIAVKNLGNGSLDRQILLNSPWYLIEPEDGKFSIGPHGSRVIKVAFRPELMGETSYYLSISRTSGGTTKLVGKGGDPFQLVTETVELAVDPGSGERRGIIELKNPSGKSVLVQARASTRLEASLVQDGYVIPAGGSVEVPVRLGATDTAPFDGQVEFFLKNGYAKSTRVLAPVIPAKLDISVKDSLTSELINFGKVEAGRSLERELTVTNRGGVGIPLSFHVPEPFRLLTNPGPQLAPMSSVRLVVGLFPTDTSRGLIDVTMNVIGNDQTIPVRLLGNVIAPMGNAVSRPQNTLPNLPKGFRMGGTHPSTDSPPTGIGTAGGSTQVADSIPVTPTQGDSTSSSVGRPLTAAEKEENRTSSGFVARPLAQRNIDPSLRRPEELVVLLSGSDFLELGWTAPKDIGNAHFEVEVSGMLVNEETGEPVSVWVPYPEVKIQMVDRLVKAKLTKLSPVRRYDLRAVLVTEDGRSSPPSNSIIAETTLPMDWTYIYLTLGILLLAGLGYAIYRIWLARRPDVYQSEFVDL